MAIVQAPPQTFQYPSTQESGPAACERHLDADASRRLLLQDRVGFELRVYRVWGFYGI